jgi:hypothetical protein
MAAVRRAAGHDAAGLPAWSSGNAVQALVDGRRYLPALAEALTYDPDGRLLGMRLRRRVLTAASVPLERGVRADRGG